jgi:hypothetical protein
MAISLASNFNVGVTQPIDSRLVVDTRAQLTSIPNQYSGMQVYAADTKKLYYLESTNSWLEVSLLNASVQTTGAQNISGTKTFISNTVLYSGVNVTFNKDANVVFSGTPTFNSGINSNILFNTQTSAFNFDSTMNGKMILINSATAVTGTLPVGLQDGYNVSLTQVGAGKITIAATSPASRQQRLGLYSSAGQYAVISLINTGSNGFLLYGDLN